MIPAMFLALTLTLFWQDPAIDEQIKALSHEDIAVRERATAGLLKTPLAKLSLLEKHLKGPDAESCARVRKVMVQMLASHLGSRKSRFDLRPLADRKVMEAWIDAGADPKRPPEAHEACRYHPRFVDPGEDDRVYKREWVLVEPACITQEDVKSAQADIGMERRGWLVRFELTDGGAKKLDKTAALLFKRSPRGQLGILLDGKILSAPLMNAERFGGSGIIEGNYTEIDAKELAQALQGDWLESSMRAEKEKEGAPMPEKTSEFIRGVKGMGRVTIQADASGLDIAGFVDIKEVDLLSLWQSLREQGYRLVPKN
jgi:hypothetical protein